ncbi:E3 ubiquitin-protein ligase TRIM35-like isoform X1 [Sardina pilchardus]|uniref:E3 ubiquitin-protein ligase TRIM35-like isoform X1 n=1 Tax=Sardina pilchardus TaxID=27697 RepID=UPI002E1354A8
MACKTSLSEEDLTCPVCRDIFRDPVVLSCSHSVCKGCLRQFWNTKPSRECPLCRKRSLDAEPPCNLALRNLCEAVLSQREGVSESDRCRTWPVRCRVLCTAHGEQFKLFCLQDKEPLCVVCRDSRLHKCHECQPLDEAALDLKEKLRNKLPALQEKLKVFIEIKQTYDETAEHIKCQAQSTQRQIKREFEKLHQFLQEEEATRLEALQAEVEQKTTLMKSTFDKMAREILLLSDTIRTIEEEIRAEDIAFLVNVKGTMERAQCTLPDPERASGALLNVAQHMGNLKFNVWKKMQDLVQYTPVILDPNTADPRLNLSDDLTSVTYSDERQQLPDNPERFNWYLCVLGSEGLLYGTHSWDVDVGDSTLWMLGVAAESNQRKGLIFFNSGVWCVLHMDGKYKSRSSGQTGSPLPVNGKLRRVRVQLDLAKGAVSFSDAAHDTHLHTFRHTFSERVFPFFFNWCAQSPLRILPQRSSITMG